MRFSCGVLLLLFCFATVSYSAHSAEILVDVHRLVVIGDIHGDAENFLRVLRLAELIEDDQTSADDIFDSPPKWQYSVPPNKVTSMRTTLIQMGDLIDRGEQDLESLNIAIALQEQTAQSGSMDKVVLLLGNHELLNLQGHYHYVNKKNYGGFQSQALRNEGMKTTGAFGKYMVDNFTTAYLDEGILFVHAGIETAMKISNITTLNDNVRQWLRQHNFRTPSFGSGGPLWTRKMILESMSDECNDVMMALQMLNATHVVVGHTPLESGHVEYFCDGKVIDVDVGMSRWMYGNVAALEMIFLRYNDTLTGLSYSRSLTRELREGTSSTRLDILDKNYRALQRGEIFVENDLDSDL